MNIMHTFTKEPIEVLKMEDLTLPTMRLYKTPKGNVYPSVTTQLGSLGKAGIEAWKKRVGEEQAEQIKVAAANRGTRVHNLIDDFINESKVPRRGIMPTDIDMYLPIRNHLIEHVDIVYGNEFPLYSDVLKCAGRCDLFARYKKQPSIIDFKTSTKVKLESYILSYKLQATAYAMMIREVYDMEVNEFHILIVNSDEGSLQVFSGKVNQYTEQCVDFFQNEYNIQKFNDEKLNEIFMKGA